MLKLWRILLLQLLLLRLSHHDVTAALCLGGTDVLASVRENSQSGEFISNIGITGDPGANSVRLCLSGADAHWFYLDARTIRLNTSLSKVLDREVQGSVLVAELTCYEDDVMQSHYRILVEIINENDNRPNFLNNTIQPFAISELTPVDSVIFTVKAADADGDTISYIIDPSSRDASFFRIDRPNTGNIVLHKPLDYETRTQLELLIWAQESNTADQFNTSASLTVNIKDGDDQYPHFLPCTPVPPDVPVCVNPTYSANITHNYQDVALDFSPGPIRGEDGDRGIDMSVIYSILSGDDHGRFVINNATGELRLTRAVNDRPLTPNFLLSVMVCQEDDRMKYSVTSVTVRLLYQNTFPPLYNATTFKGFVIQSSSPASIVSTYGNQVLQVQVSDHDFPDGLNPNVHYRLRPQSGLFHVTQWGILIARTHQLQASDRHILQVVARDEESGEEASASVDVEVLQRGQAVPRGAFTEHQMFMDHRVAAAVAVTILLMFLSAFAFLLLRTSKKRRLQNEPEVHSAVALEKNPNVILLWFHSVTPSPPVSFLDSPCTSRAFTQSESSHGSEGVYTRRLSGLHPSSSSSSSTTHLLPVVEEAECGPIRGDVLEEQPIRDHKLTSVM